MSCCLKCAQIVHKRCTAEARYEPLSVFGYKTAERLVSEGRTDDLLRYVASIEAGAAG